MVLKQKNPYWTAKAKEDLKEITKYYKKEISINMAHKKVKDLKHYADLLADKSSSRFLCSKLYPRSRKAFGLLFMNITKSSIL